MPVKCVPTEGWTRGSVEATIRFVTQQQRDALAERVRTEMERRGWNNPKLAREAELSEKTISRVINARKDPRLDTIERIARAFGIDEGQLRPPPAAPLGLGATANGASEKQSQLDRIEEKLNKLLARLPANEPTSSQTPPPPPGGVLLRSLGEPETSEETQPERQSS